MPREIEIAGRRIGPGAPPFVVAELSGNHGQSLERALALVDAAADARAHAVKLQTYTADTMTLDVDGPEFRIEDPGSLWRGESLYDLYERAHTPWEWHPALFERCRERGLVAFSSPFDATAVEFLERLEVPAYKIASFELVDLPLVRRAAATGKPLVLSTGMATIPEIAAAVDAARDAGCEELVLLKCTSAYPSNADDANLAAIPHLAELFDCPVGLSDHTPGVGVPVAATALGAVLVEKHLTLDREARDVDAAFSLEPPELAELVRETERAWRALGKVVYGPTPAERANLRFRRSLYFTRDLAAGTTVGAEDVRSIRPAAGLAPRHLETVVGHKVTHAVKRGTPVRWELLDGAGPS